MNKAILALAATALTAATPAFSAVIIDYNNVQTAENVLFSASTNASSPTLVADTNQSHIAVTFANILGLFADASGQSSTTTYQGKGNLPAYLAGTTSVTIASGSTFTAAEFNIPNIPGKAPPPEATSVIVEALFGNSVLKTTTLALGGAGQDRIRIVGDNNEVFTGFRITLLPTDAGVSALTQVRLGGFGTLAVPEPATWAMMLGGFGFMGAAMRRRRRTTVTFA